MTSSFWRGKKVFLTGHTGFKGAWLTLWLERLGAKVTGFSLPPETDPSLFSLARLDSSMTSRMGDIRDARGVVEAMRAAQPDIVLHLAALALVRPSYRDPIATYSTNVMGTVHVLDAIRHVDSVKVAVMVTTDKVYRNQGSFWAFREDDTLGGHDPYSASKAACELAVESYRSAFLNARGVAVASARAGNVIGGGDWSADRLIPDAIRAWSAGRSLQIRNPGAVRPWQHVLEALHGYLTLAERLWSQPDLATNFNFGPDRADCVAVSHVIRHASLHFGEAKVEFAQEADAPKDAIQLALDNSKARALLGVEPVWPLAAALEHTVSWYVGQLRGQDARALCLSDIEAFQHAVGSAVSGTSHAS
jgi:CDP-glucose 4,6-dehydratase